MAEKDSLHDNGSQSYAEKGRVGDLELVEIKAGSIVDAHRQLGENLGGQIQKILRWRLDEVSAEEFGLQLNYARGCINFIKSSAKNNTYPPLVRQYFNEYLASLEAWADGAQISPADHSHLETVSPTSLELAFWLQMDTLGCMSAIFKGPDAYMMFHLEEEGQDKGDGKIFDAARLFCFKIHGEDGIVSEKFFFSYPHLLPGPTFGFERGFFMSYIFQHYKYSENPAFITNMLSWVMWRNGTTINPIELVQMLAPVADGCVLNLLYMRGENPYAARVNIASAGIQIFEGTENGPRISVNIQTGLDGFSKEQNVSPEKLILYKKRAEAIANTIASAMQNTTIKKIGFSELSKILSSKIIDGPDEAWGFVSRDIKAWVVVQLTKDGWLVTALGSGPVVPGEDPHFIVLKYSV